MGKDDSDSVVFPVHWVAPLRESLPWLLLAGALWWERRQRRGNRWIVLAFAGSYLLFWALAQTITAIPSEVREVLVSVFQALLFGFVIMWLLSTRLARRARGGTFLAMLLASGIAGGLMLYMLVDTDNSNVAIPSFICLLAFWAITLVSLTVAGRLCRNRVQLIPFILCLSVLCFSILSVLFFLVLFLGGEFDRWNIMLAAAGCLTGAILLAIAPVLAVLFWHPAQRPRLQDLLKLPVSGPVLNQSEVI